MVHRGACTRTPQETAESMDWTELEEEGIDVTGILPRKHQDNLPEAGQAEESDSC